MMPIWSTPSCVNGVKLMPLPTAHLLFIILIPNLILLKSPHFIDAASPSGTGIKMHDEVLNITTQFFLFWRAFGDTVERNLPGSPYQNFSNYYYAYDDEYFKDFAAYSAKKLVKANTTDRLKLSVYEDFPRIDWRLLTEADPSDLATMLRGELSAIARLTRRVTKPNEIPINEHLVFKLSIGIERYLYPPMLVIGLIGNALTFVVLNRPIISSQGSSAIYLKMLCLHDAANLFIGVSRKWLQNVFRYDIRESSNIACKLHRFIHYTCLDASHWVSWKYQIRSTSYQIMLKHNPLPLTLVI